jgi:hypothetical protein
VNFGIRKHFLTESERSGERLLEAARRVSGSDSINRINRMGAGWIMDFGLKGVRH